jgi:hypothetical protein
MLEVQARWRLEHDPEKWIPVFGKDHAPRRSSQQPGSRPTPLKVHTLRLLPDGEAWIPRLADALVVDQGRRADGDLAIAVRSSALAGPLDAVVDIGRSRRL